MLYLWNVYRDEKKKEDVSYTSDTKSNTKITRYYAVGTIISTYTYSFRLSGRTM